MIIQPIKFDQPVLDRRFDFDHEELSTIELSARLAKKMNEVISLMNAFDIRISGKEDSTNITYNRKLSPSGNFTGSVSGRMANLVLAGIDSNSDKLKFLSGQFSDGYTGQVIDAGFFEETFIKRNYDGGLFPKPTQSGECCEDIDGGTY